MPFVQTNLGYQTDAIHEASLGLTTSCYPKTAVQLTYFNHL